MYLQKLFRHSKFWFLVVMVFSAGQLFINYKRGVVFSPFFHYGMYSGVIKPQQNYTVTEIYINGKRLAAKDFSPQEWDNIIQPAEKYYSQQEWNSAMWNTDIKRIFPLKDSVVYLNTINESSFKNWYTKRLSDITGSHIDSFNIKFTPYNFNGTAFEKEKQ